MPERGVVLAVDIGTSATKAVLFDGQGRVLSLARRSYPMLTTQADWAEQDPETVYPAVLAAMGEAYGARPAGVRVDAVAFSSQWYSIMPVSGDDRALSPYLTWSDRRSAAIADSLRRSPHARALYEATGCPLDAIYPLAKIAWLQGQSFAPRAVRYVSIKEYVFRRLFGEYVVDWSVASASGLFDMRERRWHGGALAAAGIREEQLSPPVSPRTVLTRWRPEALAETGLPQGMPCVIGAGDGVLASIGVGALGPAVAAVNVGTSAACRCLVPAPTVDPRGRLWTYALDESWWVTGGIVSSGAIVYDWFLRTLGPEAVSPECLYEEVNDLAAAVPAGAEGLIFLPHLSGEQCPIWDPETTGGLHGLTLRHTRGHVARAVLEGITASVARIVETLRERLGAIEEIRVTGGLVGSATWLRIAADMFAARIQVPESPEGSALGAAVMAWVALGMAPDYGVARTIARAAGVMFPETERQVAYQDYLARAARLLVAVKSVRG